MAGRSESYLQEDGSQGSAGVNESVAWTLRWRDLLVRTYSLYGARFRTLFLIAVTPSVFAYLWHFIPRPVIGLMSSSGWLPPRYYVAVGTAVALFEQAAHWVIRGFFFAAIASYVLRAPISEKPPLVTDAFVAVGRRIGPVAAAAVVTWAAFTISRGFLCFALLAILDRLQLLRNPRFVTVATGAVVLLLGGLLSRLGLTIPILMDNPGISVREALRRSIVKTEGWELFFTLFLTKITVLGYAAYRLVHLALTNLADRGMLSAEAYPWVQSLLYVCIAAIIESPLFIALTLLHRDRGLRRESAVAAAVG
jgi:hypothetical protein